MILALLGGGVVLGNIIAKNLNIKLDIIIPKKLGSPVSEGPAIGAICEDKVFLNYELVKDLNVSKEFIQQQIEEKKKEILERKKYKKKTKLL